MKFIKVLLLFLVFSFISCASITNQSIKSTGKINLPDPEVRLILTYTNNDIVIIGNIDITKEVEITTDYSYDKNEVIEERLGIIFKEKYLPINYNIYGTQMKPEDKILQEIIYDAITQFPEMDYILFPKIEIVKKSITSSMNISKNVIIIKFKGKAVKIRL